jgi:phytoene synthase
MTITAPAWENTLVSWAHEVLRNSAQAEQVTQSARIGDRALIESAYQYCDALTQANSRTFYLASGLLAAPKRRAVRALYAFCRVTDDIVDRSDGNLQARLSTWRCRAQSASLSGMRGKTLSGHKLVALAWADARARFRVPWGYAEQLTDGVARDLTAVRYATFDELAKYCYGVASTVGLMAMHIIGFAGADAVPYAIKLGVALQLTNILRDVGEDWQMGRLYLPQDELAAFGLTENDVAAGQVTDHWRAMMRFQIERARRLYAEAMPGIALLDRDGRFAIAAAAELYQAILGDIQLYDMDVFHRRAHIGAWGKLRRLPGIWLRSAALKPGAVIS